MVVALVFVAVSLCLGYLTLLPKSNVYDTFGSKWECSNARFGVCIKRPPKRSWTDTELSSPD